MKNENNKNNKQNISIILLRYFKEVAMPMLCIGIIPVAIFGVMCLADYLLFNVKDNLWIITAKVYYTSILVKICIDLLYIGTPCLRPMMDKILPDIPIFEDVRFIVKIETEWQEILTRNQIKH